MHFDMTYFDIYVIWCDICDMVQYM